MTKKQKRYEYHITYDKTGPWWVCKVGGAVVEYGGGKPSLTRTIADLLDCAAIALGQHSELVIHRKDGTIGRGSSSRRTYGADPKSRG